MVPRVNKEISVLPSKSSQGTIIMFMSIMGSLDVRLRASRFVASPDWGRIMNCLSCDSTDDL